MFQQEEATDTRPEQGSHHTTEAATILPSHASPGRARAVVRECHRHSQSEAGLGTLVQHREGAHCSSSGRAETCWGAGACQCSS